MPWVGAYTLDCYCDHPECTADFRSVRNVKDQYVAEEGGTARKAARKDGWKMPGQKQADGCLCPLHNPSSPRFLGWNKK